MIRRVHVIDVEVVGLQTAQRFVDGAQDSRARESLLVGLVADFESHLAGDDQLVAPALDGLAEHGFGHASLVHVGGVEEVDAGFDAAVDQFGRAGLIERFAEGHSAEAETRDVEVGVGESAEFDAHALTIVANCTMKLSSRTK